MVAAKVNPERTCDTHYALLLEAALILLGYRVRESQRAKRVSLRVLPPNGTVEVVVPQGYDHAVASLVVETHRDWIQKQQLKISASKTTILTKQQRQLPTDIHLAAIDKYFVVEYHSIEASSSIEVIYDKQLHIVGKVSDKNLVFQGLHAYLKSYGKNILPAWLWKLVEQHKTQHALRPNRVTVRLQQSRWGSCSAQGNISLNAKLLLLPPTLVDHVMLHELAHLRVHNHSQQYWDFLSLLDPTWQQKKAALRHCEVEMPSWVKKR